MERNCVFVVGVPGAGKTTSVNEFKKIFNRNVRATFKLIKQQEGQQHAQWEMCPMNFWPYVVNNK